MALKLTLAACLPAFLIALAPATLQAQSIQQFAWLEGIWVMKEGNGEFQERWKKQNETTLTGYGFMLQKGDTVMREVLRIEKIGPHWVYIAAIDKNEPTLFTLKETKDNTLIFENKEHNFPQRIAYQQKPDGNLLAWIEGKMLGKPKKEEYPMQKLR